MVWDCGYCGCVFFGEFWVYFRGIGFVSNSECLGCLGGTLDFICEEGLADGDFGKCVGGDWVGGVGEVIHVDIVWENKFQIQNYKFQINFNI